MNIVGGYDITVLIVLIVLDIILGYIKAIFIKKNFNISYSIRGLIVKSSVIITALFIDFIINVASKLDIFSKDLNSFIEIAFNAIILLACISELVSVLTNLSIITGIDYSNIPALKTFIEQQKEDKK